MMDTEPGFHVMTILPKPDRTFEYNGEKFKFIFENSKIVKDYEQIPDDHYFVRDDANIAEVNDLKRQGLDAISRGELCVLLLCGGQASRLGADKPKGSYSLSLGGRYDTLLRIQAARIRRLIEMSRKEFPERTPSICWYIMVSKSTNAAVREHLDEVANEFNIPKTDIFVFEQKEIPCFDFEGRVLFQAEHKICTAPNGNGGIYDSLKEHLPQLENRGVKYFHVYCVDNILCKVGDPTFVGYSIKNKADCAAKVIERIEPYEKVGVVCMDNGRPLVVEYSELTKELAEKRNADGKLAFRGGSIANHFFTLEFLKRVCKINLPYHAAKKTVKYFDEEYRVMRTPTEPNAIKLERFIFDVFPESRNFYVFQVNRDEEFSPLKNGDNSGVDCPSTCRRDLARVHKTYLENAGQKVDGIVYISPLVSYEGEDLDTADVEEALKHTANNWVEL